MNINKFDILIFDCDGIIFDTTILKLKAFQNTLSDFEEVYIDEFTDYFKANFGRSRFKHTRYFIEKILNQPFNEELYEKIIKDFSMESEKIYISADLCSGALELLKKLKDKHLYVASGSDQTELALQMSYSLTGDDLILLIPETTVRATLIYVDGGADTSAEDQRVEQLKRSLESDLLRQIVPSIRVRYEQALKQTQSSQAN